MRITRSSTICASWLLRVAITTSHTSAEAEQPALAPVDRVVEAHSSVGAADVCVLEDFKEVLDGAGAAGPALAIGASVLSRRA